MATHQLDINGDVHRFEAPDHWTLLEALRYRLGLTGTKQGCDKGDCGACTVLVGGKPELSCLKLAGACKGSRITTIEGLMPAHRGWHEVPTLVVETVFPLACSAPGPCGARPRRCWPGRDRSTRPRPCP